IKPARIKPARIKTPATPVRLPGLNGRSVRQLHHLGAVRVVRRALVSAIAAIAVIVGASMAVPAYAQATAAPPQAPPQVLTTPSTAVIATVERDGYTATPPPPVQWPTALHTKISDGYGPRVSPCDGCSSLHLAVDFDAGWGAEVHAMAAGVVIETNSSLLASLGNHMTIQHVIDGQVITSVYGHMQYGSTSLSVGDTVKVGQVIGLVGSTGASTGPHLHFEIRIDGEPVNPLDWLYARIG
ncbi:MAG: M23 family metallopeptidase, partial [Microbacteriaceae bacterium]|nr:M23 family metallopeptidase [Microbacteriaceae bacterium]